MNLSPAVLVAAVCLWDHRTFERSKCWILKSTTSGQVDSLRIVAIHHIRPKWVVDLLNRMPVLLELVAFCTQDGHFKDLHLQALEDIGSVSGTVCFIICFFMLLLYSRYIAPAKDKLYTRMVVGVALITALFLQLQKHQAWPASL